MNYRYELINYLIRKNNYKNYLELGIGPYKENFNNITTEVNKTGVDVMISGENILTTTTDHFFENNTDKFDIIFIDADHNESAVIRDFYNSLKIIKENGMILLHDIGPENIENTGINSSGTAYLAWLKIRQESFYTASFRFLPDYVFPKGDVLGIVMPNKQGIPLTNIELTWDFYTQNRNLVLNEIIIDDIEKLRNI